jgi:hypothetical protein
MRLGQCYLISECQLVGNQITKSSCAEQEGEFCQIRRWSRAFQSSKSPPDAIGFPLVVIYAFRKTEGLVSEANQRYLSAPEQEEWDAAICDYQSGWPMRVALSHLPERF